MVKCAALYCRSGFKPNKKEKKIIERSGLNPCKKHVFAFPKNEGLRTEWIRRLRRKDMQWNPKNFGVCELHFTKVDYVGNIAPRTKTARIRARLKSGSVPSVFKNYPVTAQPVVVTKRQTICATASARHSLEQKNHNLQIERFVSLDTVSTLDELNTKLQGCILPSLFRLVMIESTGKKILSIRIEEIDSLSGSPHITHNVTIFDDLSFKVHLKGIILPATKVKDITSTPEHFSCVSEVLNVLARLKNYAIDNYDYLQAAADILDVISEEENRNVGLVASFCAEQLRLVSKNPNSRRYSSSLIGNAIVWDRTSPQLYDMIYNSGMLCLPHSRTLRRLTSALQVNSGINSSTMAYLEMRVKSLPARERLVNVAMDEVYTAQSVEMAGGRVYGIAAGSTTKTLFCTHINSIAGKYEDMVSMHPVNHVTKAIVEDAFNKVLKGLTEIGFTVVSVTTDNHRVNQSWHNHLGEDDRHPVFIKNPYSLERKPVHTLYDTVHIFKNLYYGLLRNRSLIVPPFPGSENPRQLNVNFDHLVRVYNLECGQPGKLAYRLTDKVLNPSALERVKVSLAAAATHESTTQALRYFAKNQPGCQQFIDTAEFLELVRRWFDACNVKSKCMADRLNDLNRVPLQSNCDLSEKALNFINEFGTFMLNWLEDQTISSSKKMSKDTCMAVFYTSRGLTSLAKYLLQYHEDTLNYVLLGKIQSDRIEAHFGHLRKLAGGNYWASVRQFMENEKIIRIRSLIWWSGYAIGQLSNTMIQCQQDCEVNVTQVVEELAKTINETNYEEIEDSTKAALGHIAGYLARSAARGNKCIPCATLLVDKEPRQMNITFEKDDSSHGDAIFKSFSQSLDRGKLLVPSITAIKTTTKICHIWRAIMKHESSSRKLIECVMPRKVFVELVSRLIVDDVEFTEITCDKGHLFSDKILKRMSAALFNLFAGNMVREINSNARSKSKIAPQNSRITRSQSDYKRRKLTGSKKS